MPTSVERAYPMKKTRPKRHKLYGGFVADKLAWLEVDDGWGGHNLRHAPALFFRRQEARCQYEDVRPVEVSVIERKR
jgi:hypothetical protein